MELKLDIRPSGLVQFFENDAEPFAALRATTRALPVQPRHMLLLYPVMQMTFGARRKAGHGLGALGGSHPDGFGL